MYDFILKNKKNNCYGIHYHAAETDGAAIDIIPLVANFLKYINIQLLVFIFISNYDIKIILFTNIFYMILMELFY